jgi:hypothetical protein
MQCPSNPQRQVRHDCAACRESLAHADNLVGVEVADDDDAACAEGRGENLLDIGAEGIAVHSAIENKWNREAAGA